MTVHEVNFDRSTKPDEAIVETLERWLEQAKRGEIESIALAAALSDGGQTTEFNSGANRKILLLQSAVTTLFFRVGTHVKDMR